MIEEARRCDLYLRTKYPHLKTKIFKFNNGWYGIYADNYPQPFSSFEDEFNNKIKPITYMVCVLEKKPENVEEIPIVKDNEIASDYAGIPYTIWQIERLIQYKFSDISVIGASQEVSKTDIILYVRNIKNNEMRKKLTVFIDSLKLKAPFRIVEDENDICLFLENEKKRKSEIKDFIRKNPNLPDIEQQISNPVFNMLPIKKGFSIKKEELDEQFFFERIEDIYKGNIKKSNIISDLDDSLNCYIDYSLLGSDNVNIRNGIVLYDKIFIDLPLMKSLDEFCNEQKIKKDEFLELCNSGKINVVLSHPGFQYDNSFTDAIYNSSPNSIITRRLISSLIIADLVEINNSYFINNIDGLLENSYEISKEIAEKFNKKIEAIYDFLLWPQMALRKSFESFLFDSPMRIPSFGINNTFSSYKTQLNADMSQTIDFELGINADKVHIANAFNAIYFPYHEINGKYTNRPATSLMADRLNFYKNASIEKSLSYFENRKSIIAGEKVIMPIDLIDINEYIPIAELNKLSEQNNSSNQFNSIFSFLAQQSSEERLKTIKNYNELVQKEINKRNIGRTLVDFSITAGLDGIGLLVPFLGIGTAIAKKGAEKTGISSKLKKQWETTQEILKNGTYNEKKAISFLAKISPVARLNYYN